MDEDQSLNVSEFRPEPIGWKIMLLVLILALGLAVIWFFGTTRYQVGLQDGQLQATGTAGSLRAELSATRVALQESNKRIARIQDDRDRRLKEQQTTFTDMLKTVAAVRCGTPIPPSETYLGQ